MTIPLRQSTASQEIPLGYFLDSTDGNTEETALSIANTDIKLWKHGATTLANKNSGGATHISNGVYYCVLDATDTNTLGGLTVFIHETGALPVRVECRVLAAHIYDTLVVATDKLEVDLIQMNGVAQSALDLKDFADAGYDPATNKVQGVVLTDTTTTNTDMVAAAPTAAANADAVWDELKSAHTIANSFGDYLDDEITSRNAVTPDAAGVAPTAVEIRTEMDSNSVDLNAILADTNELQLNQGNWATATGFATSGALTTHDGKLDTVDTNVDAILVDTGTTIPATLTDMKGATFATGTDSLEAIRNRGDSEWVTGAGGSDRLLMVDTTIATLASQTSFTLAAGSPDNDAYNNCTIVIEDASTATQKAVGIIFDYVGATKTVTLKYNPAIFTITTSDKVYILAENALKATLANRQLNVAADGDIAGNIDGSVASVVGHTAQTGDSYARLGAPAGASIAADLLTIDNFVDDLESRLSAARAGYLDNLSAGAAALASVCTNTRLAELDAANLPTDVSNVKTDTAAILTDTTGLNGDAMRGTDGANTTTPPTAAANADAVWDELKSGHTVANSFGDFLDIEVSSRNSVTPDVAGTAATPAEVATELATYDGPTNGEMVTAFTEIKGATWAAGTDTLEHIRNKQTDIEADTAAILIDTNELQTDWVNGGRLDLLLDACALEATVGALNDISAATVNAQVVDVLKTDVIAEMGAGAPPASPTFEQAVNYLYRLFRNKTLTTSSLITVRNDADAADLFKANISDDATTFTKAEYVTG